MGKESGEISDMGAGDLLGLTRTKGLGVWLGRGRGSDRGTGGSVRPIGWRGSIARIGITCLVVSVGLLAGCGGGGFGQQASDAIGSGSVLPFYGLEGLWSGPVLPRDSGCGQPRHGLMRVGSGVFAFDPFGSTTVINGTVKADTFEGTLSRLGAEHRELSINFRGRARADADSEIVEGTLTSGRCSWVVKLTRS